MNDEHFSKPTMARPQRRWDAEDEDSAPMPNVRKSGSSMLCWWILGIVGVGVVLSGIGILGATAFFLLTPRVMAPRKAMAAAPRVDEKKGAI